MEQIEIKDNCPSIYPKYYLEDSILKKIHLNSLPPNDAYYFFPKGELTMKLNEKKPSRGLRKIFKIEFGEYTAFELDQLVRFHKLMEIYQVHHTIEFPSDWTEADNLRYIYSTNCNLPQSLKDMIEHFNWRKAFFPMSPTSKEIEILNLGFVYIFGRDKDFRPIIICQALVFIEHEKEYTREEWVRAGCLLCEYAEKNVFLPGHVETWNMITNVRKANVLFFPSILKHAIQVMSNNYRARLHANFIIGMSSTMRFLYKIICNFIDEVTVAKLKIIEDIHDGVMSQLINEDNFEVKFGGKAKDLVPGKDIFFPPYMPPGANYFLDTEKREEKLISEKEYRDLYMKGLLNVVSPLFLQREKEEKEKKEKEEYEARLNKLRIEKEKEEKMKETERFHNEFNEFEIDTKYYTHNSSEDTTPTNSNASSSRKMNYCPSEQSDMLSFRAMEVFINKKKLLNSTSPKIKRKEIYD